MNHPLYIQIAEAIKAEMLAGRLKPGERLTSIRRMTGEWKRWTAGAPWLICLRRLAGAPCTSPAVTTRQWRGWQGTSRRSLRGTQ
jgi:hypothetical protein